MPHRLRRAQAGKGARPDPAFPRGVAEPAGRLGDFLQLVHIEGVEPATLGQLRRLAVEQKQECGASVTGTREPGPAVGETTHRRMRRARRAVPELREGGCPGAAQPFGSVAGRLATPRLDQELGADLERAAVLGLGVHAPAVLLLPAAQDSRIEKPRPAPRGFRAHGFVEQVAVDHPLPVADGALPVPRRLALDLGADGANRGPAALALQDVDDAGREALVVVARARLGEEGDAVAGFEDPDGREAARRAAAHDGDIGFDFSHRSGGLPCPEVQFRHCHLMAEPSCGLVRRWSPPSRG